MLVLAFPMMPVPTVSSFYLKLLKKYHKRSVFQITPKLLVVSYKTAALIVFPFLVPAIMLTSQQKNKKSMFLAFRTTTV